MYFFENSKQSSHLGLGALADDRDNRLKEMAKWPEKAHNAFKRLGLMEKNLVAVQMAAKYGSDFAKSFLAQLGKRKPQDMVSHYYGIGVGPKPARLLERGFKLAQKDSIHEWWVHPSGEEVVRNYGDDAKTATAAQPQPQPPRSARCQDMDMIGKDICQNAERICALAEQVKDEYSRSRCQKARDSCQSARQNASTCV